MTICKRAVTVFVTANAGVVTSLLHIRLSLAGLDYNQLAAELTANESIWMLMFELGNAERGVYGFKCTF